MITGSGKTSRILSVAVTVLVAGVAAAVTSYRAGLAAQAPPFHLLEATIDDVHRAIRAGQINCHGLVQAYVNRAQAYNGVSNQLVTADGAPVPAVRGEVVRGGTSLEFPTKTVKAATLLPHLDEYAGPSIELGRMEATASDPNVQQQFGMTVGMPNAGQLDALRIIVCTSTLTRRKLPLGVKPPPPPLSTDTFRLIVATSNDGRDGFAWAMSAAVAMAANRNFDILGIRIRE